jgi:hypothetical protein
MVYAFKLVYIYWQLSFGQIMSKQVEKQRVTTSQNNSLLVYSTLNSLSTENWDRAAVSIL